MAKVAKLPQSHNGYLVILYAFNPNTVDNEANIPIGYLLPLYICDQWVSCACCYLWAYLTHGSIKPTYIAEPANKSEVIRGSSIWSLLNSDEDIKICIIYLYELI